MLGRDQPRKNVKAAGLYRKIMITAAERLSSILHDAQAPTFRSIVRDKFFESHHGMGDAMNRFVIHISGHIVKQQIPLHCAEQNNASTPESAGDSEENSERAIGFLKDYR